MNDIVRPIFPHRPFVRSFAACAAALALIVAFAGSASADAEAKTPTASEERQVQAGRAYDDLLDSANERFAKAQEEEATGIELELLDDFEAFAREFEGTNEAVYALLQTAVLARMADAHERGEKNLKHAATLTDDASLQTEIMRELRNLQVRRGAAPPPFSATTFDGKTVSPDAFEGKVLLLDFWATWCAPCIAELPMLKKVYETYHSQGLEVLSISLDADRDYARKFVVNQEMDWLHTFSEAADDVNIADLYGVATIPRMILVGREGTIVNGSVFGDGLEEAVKEALGE